MEEQADDSKGDKSCRKRGRSEDPDCDECMPISKRINRLCIRPSIEGWNSREDEAISAAFNNNVQLEPTQSSQSSWPDSQASPTQQMPGGAATGPWPPITHSSQHPIAAGEYAGPQYPHTQAPSPDRRVPSTDSGVDFAMDDYVPELTEDQNPMYYHINGVLFDANRCRMQRLNGLNSPTGDGQRPEDGHHGNWQPSLQYPHQ